MVLEITDPDTIRKFQVICSTLYKFTDEHITDLKITGLGFELAVLDVPQSMFAQVKVDKEKVVDTGPGKTTVYFSDMARVIQEFKKPGSIIFNWDEEFVQVMLKRENHLVTMRRYKHGGYLPPQIDCERMVYKKSDSFSLEDRELFDILAVLMPKKPLKNDSPLLFTTKGNAVLISCKTGKPVDDEEMFLDYELSGITYRDSKPQELMQEYLPETLYILKMISKIRGKQNRKDKGLIERLEIGMGKPLRFTKIFDCGITVNMLFSPVKKKEKED